MGRKIRGGLVEDESRRDKEERNKRRKYVRQAKRKKRILVL